MDTSKLKRKLRQLKKLEAQIRFNNMQLPKYKHYIWDEYFSTKNEFDDTVKYNMSTLTGLDHVRLKEVLDEYFIHVYFQYYKENGMAVKGLYDTSLLKSLGLPPDSSLEAIKSRFRELVKMYHPDLGGDSSKFIELVEIYRKLIGDD